MKTSTEDFKNKLSEKFTFTNKSYIDEYVDMTISFAIEAIKADREDAAEKAKLNHYEYRCIDGIGMFRETKYKEKHWSINDGAYVQIDKSSITDRPLPTFKQ